MKIATIYNISSEYPDEAIDLTESNLIEYMKTFNPMHLKFKDGMVPVKFKVKRLNSIELSAIQKVSVTFSQEVAHSNAIGYGLLSYEKTDGTTVVIEKEEKKQDNMTVSVAKNLYQAIECLSDEFGYDIVTELGLAIVKISRMPLNISPFLSK